jgi:plastocyanin
MAAMLCAAVNITGPAYAYKAENVSTGGTISGIVKFDGLAPKRQRLEVTKDMDVCGRTPLYAQSLMVGNDGGIENAVVAITEISAGKPFLPEKGVQFDQKDCEYVPHVLVFPAGSTIEIINSDGIMHSIHTESSINPVIDMAQPGFKKVMPVTVKKPEVIEISCDAHNWMDGWWYVAGNPYYAKTDSAGRYTITDVPPGTYTLKLWQEKLGTQTREVTVKSGATTTVDFMMKPAKKGGG